MKHLPAVVLAALATGCSGPDDIKYVYNGPDEGYTNAQMAANAWAQACPDAPRITITRLVVYGFNAPGTEAMTVVDSLPLNGPDAIAGIELPTSGTILLTQYTTQSIAHELGHRLGIPHLPHGVMTANWTGRNLPTSYECSYVGTVPQ